MTRTKLSLLIPLIGSFSAPTWAEETEQPASLNLQATVVSATRSEASIASIPGSVQVIDEQQIRITVESAGTIGCKLDGQILHRLNIR